MNIYPLLLSIGVGGLGGVIRTIYYAWVVSRGCSQSGQTPVVLWETPCSVSLSWWIPRHLITWQNAWFIRLTRNDRGYLSSLPLVDVQIKPSLYLPAKDFPPVGFGSDTSDIIPLKSEGTLRLSPFLVFICCVWWDCPVQGSHLLMVMMLDFKWTFMVKTIFTLPSDPFN